MDTSNYQGGTSGGESTMESVDWRTQMPADSRQKIVIKIMDTLKKHHPSLALEKPQEIKSIAQRLEEKIYTTTTNQADYLRKISVKLMNIERRSANVIPNSLQCNSSCSSVNPSDPGSHGIHQVNNQGQPLPIPVSSNHPQAAQQILSQSIHSNIPSSGVQVSAGVSSTLPPVNGLSQSTISNISSQNPNLQNFVNQRQIPARQQQQQSQNSQQYLYRHQIHQIAKHSLQQNYSVASGQSHIQQQHQNLLQPGHFQPSSLSTVQQNQQPVIQHHQQSALRQQRQQPQASIVHQQPPPPQSNPVGQQTNATNLQHNQQQQQQQPRLLSQQNNLSNVQQPHQHSIGQHNNFPAMHQQHVGPHSSSTGQQHTMLNNQHSTQVMQSKVSIPQQNQSMQGQRSQPELQTQSGQLQQQLKMKQQPYMSQRDMQQRLPTSGAFQQQNVIDQQQKQLFQQQRAMPEASSTSSDSTAQTGNPNNGDWQEEVYQKIKAMKDKYMPELNELYPKIMRKLQQYDSLPQQPKNEQFEKMKMLKHICESCLNFLHIPRTNILPIYKEKLDSFEKQIINIILTFNRKPGPHLHTQLHPHESHMNTPNSTMLQLKQLQHHRQIHQHFLQQKQQLLHQQQQQFKQTKQQQLQLTQLPHISVKMESLTKPGPPFSPPNIDQLTSVTKSGTGTPLQSANSPFTMSSPSTPSTSHIPGDSEKVNSGIIPSLSNAGNVGHQSNAAILPPQSLPFGTPGISASHLLAEFTSPDGNHTNDALVVSGKSSSTIEQPIEHLLKVVKSISAKSLSASVSDIGSVVSMIDSIAGSGTGNNTSRAAIGEDLVATTKSRLQSRTTGKRKTKPLNVVSSASSVNDSFKHFNYFEASELESTATSSIKRPRIKTSNALLEEIRGINWGLIDTMVDISEEDAGSGTVVKCSFGAVALGPNIKSQYASAKVSAIQPLRLLVPKNYPNCSPILLDKFPVEIRESKEEELEDLSMKAKWRFCSCMRTLSEPMSLEEMARTWDSCARAVISEYAHQTSGGAGGTFTSKYGPWEDCLTFTASA